MKQLSPLILKGLDFTVWKIRFPIILNNKIPIRLLIQLKLLIISDILISLNDSFIQDVIRSMRLNPTEIHIITFDQINSLMMPKYFLNCCWWLGVKKLHNYHCVTFTTPALSLLKRNINAKRALWNQINLFLRDMH